MYALKETNVRNLSQQERQEAVNEIRLLASVQQNAAISGFHEAFIDGNRLCIVMEYAPFGDLSRALRKRQAQRKLLPEDLIWSYFIQIARGLQALHAQKILHRDVKTANVLRMSGEIVKLGDLGVAKLMKGAMTNTQIGTPHYMPPEVWRNRPYTFNSDVWALGCVLFEMCTFAVPFEARSMEELRFKVMKGKFPALPAVYSSDMQKMVRWLMIAEPSQRPDVDAVLDHPSVRRRAHLAPEPEPLVPEDNARVSEEQRGAPRGAGGAADQPGSAVTLGTIKVPKNLKMLKKRLPAPSYPSDHEKAAKERAAAAERAEKEQRLAQARGRALSAAAAAEKDNEQEKTAKELSKEPNVVELKAAANASAAQAPAAPAARARNALAPPARARGAPSAAANARRRAPSRSAKPVWANSQVTRSPRVSGTASLGRPRRLSWTWRTFRRCTDPTTARTTWATGTGSVWAGASAKTKSSTRATRSRRSAETRAPISPGARASAPWPPRSARAPSASARPEFARCARRCTGSARARTPRT